MYICLHIYIYIIYIYIYQISISISIYIYISVYIVIVCDHEITHTSDCLKARQTHFEETVYFLTEIPGTH